MLIVYSLRHHTEVKRIYFRGEGIARIEASASFLVVVCLLTSKLAQSAYIIIERNLTPSLARTFGP
jgi:hypothetical protein